MAGDWEIGEPSVPPRLARAVLEFTDGTAVYLTDGRAFATLVVRPSGAEALPPLGLDAASPEVNGAYLLAALAARRAPIKQALLDQAVLAGLGNIYAAEALWHAGLSPLVPANELGLATLDRLAVAIHLTLALAQDDPGRYSRGEGIERLAVYGREGEPCVRCGTAVARLAQAGRSTYWCPGCQKRPRARRARLSRVPRAAHP
jgi:formamidopyrimidine-DNA glycosylase